MFKQIIILVLLCFFIVSLSGFKTMKGVGVQKGSEDTAQSDTGAVNSTPRPLSVRRRPAPKQENVVDHRRKAPKTECYNMIQGKVAWERGGSKKWQDKNVRNLCSGTTNPLRTVSCFQQGIYVHNNWSKAIKECKEPQGKYNRRKAERMCYGMVQGKVAWSRNGSKKWQGTNVNKLCSGTTKPRRTVNCFQQRIATHNNWSQAINECRG